jgi:hypothetical protein
MILYLPRLRRYPTDKPKVVESRCLLPLIFDFNVYWFERVEKTFVRVTTSYEFGTEGWALVDVRPLGRQTEAQP